MHRNLALTISLSSLLALGGCTVPKQFDATLTEPRPETVGISDAMLIAAAIETTADCVGCQDTMLWPNEAGLSDKVGFDTLLNIEKAQEAHRQWERARDRAKWKNEPIPPEPKMPTASATLQTVSPYMLADSLDGRWTNPGASLGVGIALDVVVSLLTPEDRTLHNPPADNLKAAFVLPDMKSIPSVYNEDVLTKDEKERRNAGYYAATEWLKLLTKAAEDLGYTAVGPLQFPKTLYRGKPDWSYSWQPLENEAIGCPTVTADSERDEVCRVEWAPYFVPLETKQWAWKLNKKIVPKALGGDGKTERWVASFGYPWLIPSALRVEEAKNVTESDALRDFRFALALQKHLNKNWFVYVPAYEIAENHWTPQRVLTEKGVHYFSFIVPEGTKALPVDPDKVK